MREKILLQMSMKSPRGKAINVSDQKEEPQAKMYATNLKG